jgi:hypothetical protein
MGTRLELSAKLRDILGSSNVYFNPPENQKLNYPCIIYRRTNINKLQADNSAYRKMNVYSVMVIDSDPESEFPDKIAELPMCSFNASYISDNLYHNVFTLYY